MTQPERQTYKTNKRHRRQLPCLCALLVMLLLCTAPAPLVSAAPAQLPLKKQIAVLDRVKGGQKIRKVNGARLSKASRAQIKKAVKRIHKKGAQVGFVVMDLQSGHMISYDAKTVFFGASTIKAPYVTAVNQAQSGAWNADNVRMKKAVINSDNQAYAFLRIKYGSAPMSALCKKTHVSQSKTARIWPYYNARDLAKLWCGSYTYLKKNQTTPEKLRNALARSKRSAAHNALKETAYTKPGWMYFYMRPHRKNLHDAGIVMGESGPYVFAVMTTLDGGEMKALKELVRALNGAAGQM